ISLLSNSTLFPYTTLFRSHCISDYWKTNVGGSGGSTNFPGDRRAERSNCAVSDTRQVFGVSAVLQTPKFSNTGLRLIAGNWQVRSEEHTSELQSPDHIVCR